MTDDLRTRASGAAAVASIPCTHNQKASYREGYIDGALWHAAQQPTRDDISDAIEHSGIAIGTTDAEMAADAVLALLGGGRS